MKPRNVCKTISLAALSTAILSTLMWGNAVPAIAVIFRFCGNFEDGGRVVEGMIDVTSDGDFDSSRSAKITTTTLGGDPRMYTQTDFVDRTSATHPDTNILSFKYTFRFDSLPVDDNKFEVYIPQSAFPFNGSFPTITESFSQYEMRDGTLRKDIDKLIVPEPLTILGSVTAIGMGTLLKKEYSKRQKKTGKKA